MSLPYDQLGIHAGLRDTLEEYESALWETVLLCEGPDGGSYYQDALWLREEGFID